MSEQLGEATFVEVRKDGQVLVLQDGRKLRVNPGDITFVVCWSPTAKLEISEGTGTYSLNVRNTVNDDVIRARWM